MKDNNAIIDPILQEHEKTTMFLNKKAMEEFGYDVPLEFKLYNQIRYYEEYGKLHLGVNVAGVESLAEQFGVTPKQIMKAYDNLTNKRRLGQWVVSDAPIFRNVKRVWVSNARLKNGAKNTQLLQQRSTTPPAEEQASPLLPPLLENE